MHLWISFTLNAAVLFVDVAIQPEVRFIAKPNSLMKIGNNGNLVLGLFDESTPCLMIVLMNCQSPRVAEQCDVNINSTQLNLMNCQTKLRINHLTAVKSVAILEIVIVLHVNLTQRRNSPWRPGPTVPNSVYATMDLEVHEQMYWSGGHSDAKQA
ncbi:hypothetical protein TNCV_2909691 [Trichonephila clavipes]|nr:hypothetical protein TNCV_2909691 [Trichonephila clavipes]